MCYLGADLLIGWLGFAIVYPEFLSCRTRPNPSSSSVDILNNVSHPSAMYWKISLNYYGLGFHLLEADKWQKDVRVGLHQSMFKQKQLWSIHH